MSIGETMNNDEICIKLKSIENSLLATLKSEFFKD